MSLRTILSNYGFVFQRELFPALEEELGPLGERYELFITVLGFVQVEQFLTCLRGLPGRPQEDRTALARAFIAKAVFAITTTRALIERLAIDPSLRRLCGWSRAGEVPGRQPSRVLSAPSLTAPCRAVCTRRSSTRPCGIIWLVTCRAIRRQLKGARKQRRSRSNRPPRNGGAVVRARASNGPRRRAAWSASCG